MDMRFWHGQISDHHRRVRLGREVRRRQLLDLLAQGERPVNELVASMDLAQPLVSKHLRMLREVGLVEVRDAGRQRLYRVNGHALKPLHDWVRSFERMWEERFTAMDDVLADLVESTPHPPEEHPDGHDEQH